MLAANPREGDTLVGPLGSRLVFRDGDWVSDDTDLKVVKIQPRPAP